MHMSRKFVIEILLFQKPNASVKKIRYQDFTTQLVARLLHVRKKLKKTNKRDIIVFNENAKQREKKIVQKSIKKSLLTRHGI